MQRPTRRPVPHLRPFWRGIGAVALSLLLAGAAGAAENNLPVPRFVTLRADEVYLRTGPGERYPIEWVYKRKGLPLEVVAEFDIWRKVRDWQGTEGWVHERMITGNRNVVVTGGLRTLHSGPDDASAAVARAEPGVVAHLLECGSGDWCRIEAQGIKGWLKRDEMWGVFPNEKVE